VLAGAGVAYACRMPTLLRPIALHVEEPAEGDFRWVLSERDARGRWAGLDRASAAAGTYRQAMADGLLALQELVDDLDTGPRKAVDGGADADPDADAEDGQDDGSTAPKKRTLFGFGPAT